MKKLTQEQFITKAKQKHGDRYDYNFVEYINGAVKVKIICKEHGIFEQKPQNHLHKGDGCPLCNNKAKPTIEQFISKAKKLHESGYEYDLVEYIGTRVKVKIKCKIHGIFEQTPDAHLNGNYGCGCGCPKCYNKFNDINYLKRNLTSEEDPIENDEGVQCRCTYCKEYFLPTRKQLKNRINSLLGKSKGECRLYCSDECKELCPVFNRVSWPKGFKPDTSRPIQPELRQMVLERDNFVCQRCGSNENIHCHHFEGIEINPVESADIDNCVTLCDKCHGKVHHQDGCGYNDMKREKC